MDALVHLDRLGFDWRPESEWGPGVIVTVSVQGRTVRAFVPLTRLWITFDRELQKVGCPGTCAVGAPFSMVGFLGFIKKAGKALGGAASSLVPKAIKRAGASIVSTAKQAGSKLLKAAGSVPVLGGAIRAGTALAMLPARAAQQLISGKRIDQIAIGQFKDAVTNVRELAPYVQTVVSMVPGIGTGVSAGIGGALALAQGKPIDEVALAAVRSAIPGGPAAQAAFSVAEGIAEGKAPDQIAINALPISAAAKSALVQGVTAAKDLAAGKPVSQVVIDRAVSQLPPHLQKAVQIGTAMGQAKSLQQAAGTAVQSAQQIAGDVARGTVAERALRAGQRGAGLFAAVQRGQASRGALAQIVRHAQGGHPQARNIVAAFQRRAPAPRAQPFAAFGRPAPRPAGVPPFLRAFGLR